MDTLREDIREHTEVLRKGIADVCGILTENGEKLRLHLNGPQRKNKEDEEQSVPMDFIDACGGMMRYEYSLSGQGKGPALHLFPPRKTQIELYKTVVRLLLECPSVRLPACTADKKSYGKLDALEMNPEADADRSGDRFAELDRQVERILRCRVVRNGRATNCIPPEYYKEEERERNTVQNRLPDQRCRFHEFTTSPLVLAWMRYADFEGYDSSKSLKKQTKEVYEAAANAFESKEDSVSPYQDENLYGKSYSAACHALLCTLETFGDNGLGYVRKVIPDEEELANVIVQLETNVRQPVLGKRKFNKNCTTSKVYQPHQVAFVFTKARLNVRQQCGNRDKWLERRRFIFLMVTNFSHTNLVMVSQVSARLQVLSKYNVEGGHSAKQVEKGHMRGFLSYTIEFDATLLEAIKYHRDNEELFKEGHIRLFKLLGVNVEPLDPEDRKRLELALHGRTSLPMVMAKSLKKESYWSEETEVGPQARGNISESDDLLNDEPEAQEPDMFEGSRRTNESKAEGKQ